MSYSFLVGSTLVLQAAMLTCIIPFTTAMDEVTELPFLDLGDETRVPGKGKFFGILDAAVMLNETELPSFLPFPFDDSNETRIFISTHGTISFGSSFFEFVPRQFPISQKIVAPYWDDSAITEKGLMLYAALIEGQESRLNNSQDIFDTVNGYITDSVLKRSSVFRAHWILAVRWINVCPYFDSICSTTEPNTFQAVLATNGTKSYAVFTYECGKLNWMHYSAAIGFSASDDFFAEHPLSRNRSVNDIACINEDSIPPSNWSNVAYEITNARIYLDPTFGNREGGTGVVVTGPIFISTDNVTCIFDGQEVNGVVLSDDNAVLCTTPRLRHIGRISVMIRHNQILLQKQAYFYSVPFERGSVVDIEADSLLLKNGSTFKLKWPRNFLVPSLKSIEIDSGVVDIKLYERNLNSESQPFRELATLASDIPNTGESDIVIPDLSDMVSEGICPVSVRVEVKTNLPSNNPIQVRSLSQRLVRIGEWIGEMYLMVEKSVISQKNNYFHDKCQDWVETQRSGIGDEILDLVSMHYPCPPTLNRAQAPNSGFDTDLKDSQIWPLNDFNDWQRNFFHPNTFKCFRQSGGFELTKGYGNQCCYDNQGDIIVGPPGGGTVDLVSPGRSKIVHFFKDVLPFIWCCKGEFPNCRDTYYKFRPSDDGSRYNPPPPACVYGDPHLVTLDLHKYTFNGYGEFVLIETMDDLFTLQGRMVEATANTTLNISSTGTIFSALVAEESYSDTIQLQLDPLTGISALVNEEKIDFSDITEQEFNNVTVTDLGSKTITATFSSGVFLKVQEENGIISVMIVSLPSSYRNKTRGLMGNYNGDKLDDLIPRGENESLPLDSTLQDIHEQFGMTWIISNSDDSLFFYNDDQNWATFYRPQYSPLFEAVFTSPELEEKAKKLCKNDNFCLYDIAATGRVELGMTTLRGSEDFEELVELSAPVVCKPPCQNGACVDNNTCRCSEGYTGSTCDTVVYTECIQNPCQNQGTCRLLAGSYSCVCMIGYTGNFCEDDIPTNSTEPTNDQVSIIIGATIGSIALVLCVLIAIIIIIIAVVMRYNRRNKSKSLENSEEKSDNRNTYDLKTY